MNTKILFTDLDETLLNSQKVISASLHDKIIEMLEAGHKFVFASGRTLPNIQYLRNQLSIPKEGVYITAYNGAVVYDCEHDRILAQNKLANPIAHEIYQQAIDAHLFCIAFSESHLYIPWDGSEFEFYQRNSKQNYRITQNLSEVLPDGSFKLLTINLNDNQFLQDFRKKITARYGNEIDSSFSNSKYLEFYSSLAGKGNGIRLLCHALQFPLSNAYACGDEENDVSMFQAAGTGIAMINGSPKAKAAADYITTHDCDHDALVEVIDRFIL